jgi:hypothetical protein
MTSSLPADVSPLDRLHGAASDERVLLYTGANGLIVACSSCGRLRRADGSSWEWVPGLVTHEVPNVSHGLCATCDLQYYDDQDASA